MSIISQYEAVLKAIKSITKADDCSIFLLDSELEMDEEEKKEIFNKQIERIRDGKHVDETAPYHKFLQKLETDNLSKYSILNYFIGSGEHWRLKDYKNRPNKYIIFNWKSRLPDPIVKEGLTAYTVRTGEVLVLNNRTDVEKHPAFAGINEGEIKIHDICHQVAIVPIRDNEKSKKIIGAIRCDIYKFSPNPVFTEEETVPDLLKVNDVLCKIINLGKKSEQVSTYNSLFHGINILEALKGIEAEIRDEIDQKIYKLTKKLFYVLKRRRYFGYEAIIERILGYVKDICDTLGLDNKPLITLLENFKKHEDLMLYSSVVYRDHFMHQFHVFITGYIILHYVGINNVTNILNDKIGKPKRRKLTIQNTLRIWFLASIFHDVCYLLSKFDKNIGKFLTELLESSLNKQKTEDEPTKFKFIVKLKWDQLAKKEAKFMHQLSELSEFFGRMQQTNSSCKLNAELSRLMLYRNHGVLSALIMLQKMAQANTQQGNSVYDIEKNIAALAIALHTSEAYQKVKSLLGKDLNEQIIFFENYPIVFLLAFCDFFQEWGRKTSEKAKSLGTPIFKALSYDQTTKNIYCNLLYIPSYSNQPNPNEDQLAEWAKTLNKTFSSLEFSFIINYFNDENLIYSVNLKSITRRRGIRIQCEQICSIKNGNDLYLTEFSHNSITNKCDIGFGTSTQYKKGQEIDINFIYNNMDLSGKYKVERVVGAAENMPYTKFIGAIRPPKKFNFHGEKLRR